MNVEITFLIAGPGGIQEKTYQLGIVSITEAWRFETSFDYLFEAISVKISHFQ